MVTVIGFYSFGVGNIETFTYGVLRLYHDPTLGTYQIEVISDKLEMKFPKRGGLSREQVDVALDLVTSLLEGLGYVDQSKDVFQGTSRFNIEHPKPKPNAIKEAW